MSPWSAVGGWLWESTDHQEQLLRSAFVSWWSVCEYKMTTVKGFISLKTFNLCYWSRSVLDITIYIDIDIYAYIFQQEV